MVYSVDHVFVHLLIICLSSLARCLFRSLPICNASVCFIVVIMCIQILYQIYVLQIFFLPGYCFSFGFLNKVVHRVEIFNFIKYVIIFPFICGLFLLCVRSQSSWSTWPNPWPCRFSSIFSSVIFIVFCFKLVCGQFWMTFGVSCKVCVYIHFIAYGFLLFCNSLLRRHGIFASFILNFQNLVAAAGRPAQNLRPLNWRGWGLHLLGWEQKATSPPLFLVQALPVLSSDLAPCTADRSLVPSGPAGGLASGQCGPAPHWAELGFLRPGWEVPLWGEEVRKHEGEASCVWLAAGGWGGAG